MKSNIEITQKSISTATFFIFTEQVSSVRITSIRQTKEWIYGLFPIMIGLGFYVEHKALGVGLVAVGIIILVAMFFLKYVHDVSVSIPGLDFSVLRTNDKKEAILVYQNILSAIKCADNQ